MHGSEKSHEDVVKAEFTRQAPNFAAADSVFARRAEATLAALGPLEPEMEVLEVACGAAHAAEAVAPHVHDVVGVDLTPAMLTTGRVRLGEHGVTNVRLEEGDASRLRFDDESFDLVFCRAAVHHFADPAGPIAEMARVCRPGGRVVIVDTVAPSADVQAAFDDLHRRIDPSHAGAWLFDDLAALVEGLVGPVTFAETGPVPALALERMWNESSARDEVVAALRREVGGGPATGFAPSVADDGTLQVTFTAGVVRAERATAAATGPDARRQ
jgi:ubiquinone/menaquinone biosynthesis C-methylase UbiE